MLHGQQAFIAHVQRTAPPSVDLAAAYPNATTVGEGPYRGDATGWSSDGPGARIRLTDEWVWVLDLCAWATHSHRGSGIPCPAIGSWASSALDLAAFADHFTLTPSFSGLDHHGLRVGFEPAYSTIDTVIIRDDEQMLLRLRAYDLVGWASGRTTSASTRSFQPVQPMPGMPRAAERHDLTTQQHRPRTIDLDPAPRI